MPNKAFLIDRDGVINKQPVVKDQTKAYLTKKEQIELIEGSAEAIKILNDNGFKTILITNQSPVGRGIITESEAIEINNEIINKIKEKGGIIHETFFCMHNLNEGCNCRKPKIGLILNAEKKYSLDPLKSYVIGDKTTDIKAGKDAGYNTILVNTGYGGKDGIEKIQADYNSKNLLTAVKEIILKNKEKKAWVTGAGGHMGQHLTRFLLDKGYRVLATYYKPTTDINDLPKEAQIKECDIRNRNLVKKFMKEFQPDEIYHLAAQSYPTVSWENPWYTIETNVLGSINIFEDVKELKLNCKIMNACTSGEYGFVNEDQTPIKESMDKKPLHPYGCSKLCQEALAYQYYKNFGIHILTFRIFNTTGPHKVNDVCADFVQRLITMEKDTTKERILRTGTLETRRAITDVRDLIKAFHIGLEKCPPGEVYNLSGEHVYKIEEIVELLRKLVNFKFEQWTDPKLLRPTDEPIIYGDSTKFKSITGWKQEIPIEQTLTDMLNFWRTKL